MCGPLAAPRRRVVSVDFDSSKQRWRVRWREQGRQRTRRFSTREEAHAFDESLRPEVEPTGSRADDRRACGRKRHLRLLHEGGCALSLRVPAIRREALDAARVHEPARRRLVESIERGEVKVARESFETFWLRLLEERRPYMTKGSAETAPLMAM
jgi:hypothetical protein